ncbi:MAG TPA: peptidylprolyl isomerase [Allosphingosinicella sp.]|nr:peptidylprolyl isomerase [Allosphingosinicella sp.]
MPTSSNMVPAPTGIPATAATPAIEPDNTLHLDISTGGRVSIQLRPDLAPNHVARIKTLTRQGFYNGIIFHRVIDGFMAQGGDPTGTGQGGSPLPDLKAEFNVLPHVRGAVAAARAQSPDSANSQFYIMLAPRLSLDGKYTVFGRVVSGMQFVDAIEKGEPPANPSRIVRASIGSDNLPPLSAAELAAAAQRQAAAAVPPAAAAPADGTPPATAPAQGATPPAAAPAEAPAEAPDKAAEDKPETPDAPQR